MSLRGGWDREMSFPVVSARYQLSGNPQTNKNNNKNQKKHNPNQKTYSERVAQPTNRECFIFANNNSMNLFG
jgi:hypothetical protein